MQPFSFIDASALSWLPVAGSEGVFELRASGQLVGRLSRVRHAGSLARGETAGGEWTFKRVGFLHPRVTVRSGTESGPVGEMDIHWRRTTVSVGGSTRYTFQRAGLAVPAWQYLDAAGRVLVHIEPVREGRALAGGSVTVRPEARRAKDLALLLLLAWYYILQEWFEDEAIVAGEAVLQTSAGPSPPSQPSG